MLNDSSIYLQELLDASSFAIAATDLDFRICYFNKMAERLYGYKSTDVIGKTVMELHSKEGVSLERLQKVVDIVKTEGRYQYTIQSYREGRLHFIESTVFAIKDKEGHLKGFGLMSTDITEKVETETKLKLQYDISKTLVEEEDTSEAMSRILEMVCQSMQWQYGEYWLVDHSEEVLRFQDGWCHPDACCSSIKGVTKKLTLSKSEGLPGRVWQTEMSDFEHNLAKYQDLERKEGLSNTCLNCAFAFPIKTPKKVLGVIVFFSERIFELSQGIKEMFDSIGGLIGLYIQRKNAEETLKDYAERLQRSNRELEQFAYVASHDLQQPLRIISGFAQLLEKRYKDRLDDEALEFIHYMVNGSKKLQNLINDLLIYSRVTTHQRPFKEVNFNRVVDTVLFNLRDAIEESGATVVVDELPAIEADETQMVQLFQNLIDNAIKYRGHERPFIFITAKKEKKEWVFSISDNGIGFDMQHAERIFEIFQRLHAEDTYKGTGIGLAICKKIVQRHGGRIWAESIVGKGSTFYFTIPTTKKRGF